MKPKLLKRMSAVTMIFCMLFASLIINTNAVQAAASPEGTVSNPVNLGTKGKYTKIWTKGNDHLDFYVKFKMAAQGYVAIAATKPLDSEGETSSYRIYMYDANGNMVWDCYTRGQQNIPTTKYSYKVGLKKGIYTIRFVPSFYVVSGKIKSTVSVSTAANNYMEIESNDSSARATAVKLNQRYTAFYGENYDLDEDWFKFKLTAGKKYKILIVNYGELFYDTAIYDLLDPNKNSIRRKGKGYLDDTGKTIITATKSGYYYLRIYNDSGYDNPGKKYQVFVKAI